MLQWNIGLRLSNTELGVPITRAPRVDALNLMVGKLDFQVKESHCTPKYLRRQIVKFLKFFAGRLL